MLPGSPASWPRRQGVPPLLCTGHQTVLVLPLCANKQLNENDENQWQEYNEYKLSTMSQNATLSPPVFTVEKKWFG